MRYKLLKEENYRTSDWTGGKTTELSIFPADSVYLERNFVWRLSSATVEVEESDFSKLPDYDRVLMVLQGEVVLSHEGQRVTRLKELEQDSFDGGFKTKSFGKITDFNLMVRKGNEGFLDVIFPENTKKEYSSTQTSLKPAASHGLYCKEGYFVATIKGETIMVNKGQLLIIDFDTSENPSYGIMGEGVIVRAQIFYDDMRGQLSAEIIPREKTSFKDFKTCIYLANIQFRWAKYIFKRLKTQWFDEELSRAIKKVEKICLTMLVFFAGGIAIVIGAVNHLEVGAIVGLLAMWVLVDCLIVSPLIYLPFMPKPVAKHIKDVDKLTPYEQKVREEELGRNEHLEKLMKKYKNSGRNLPE